MPILRKMRRLCYDGIMSKNYGLDINGFTVDLGDSDHIEVAIYSTRGTYQASEDPDDRRPCTWVEAQGAGRKVITRAHGRNASQLVGVAAHAYLMGLREGRGVS